MRNQLDAFLDRLPFHNERYYEVMAVLAVGLGGGGLVLLFKAAIHWVQEWFFTDLYGLLQPWGAWTVALLPVTGGVLVGVLRQYFVKQERHHGVAGIMEAVALAGGRLRYKRIPLKSLTAVLSIGSGASLGPEDPSVQIGATTGSFVAQKLRVSEENARVFVAMGAASGIAAAFNAPIAGVFFAVELVLGEFTTTSFGMLVFGAVMSSVLTRAIAGPSPAFAIPAYSLHSPVELIFYLALGLLAAFISVAYIRAIYRAHDWFHHSHLPVWIRPVLVGALIGVTGIWFPQIFGDSYEAIDDILFGRELVVWSLLVLLGLKIVATALSLGAGFMGGVFAPSLFLGAALGGAFGLLVDALFPSLQIVPSAFALVGMAAVLAGTVRAPVTAIMLLFEMTNDYRIILPLMFAVAISLFFSQWLHHESVYELSLARKGIRLQRGRDVDVLETLTVAEMMKPAPAVISNTLPLKAASDHLLKERVHGLPVIGRGGDLCGVLTVEDIGRAIEQNPENARKPVENFCTQKLIVAYPDETINQVLRRMNRYDIGRMPVVKDSNPRKMIGWMNRVDLIRAYDIALAKRTATRHTLAQVRLGAVSGAEVFEYEVASGSVVDGKLLAEVPWPQESLVASIQRGERLIIPHGSTVLEAGDHLAIVARTTDEGAIRALVRGDQTG
jgi:chloride channel protein, CIC family